MMNAKHHKAAIELFNASDGTREEQVERMLARYSMTADGLTTAWNEVFSENDVEGAAIGVAAANLTYPDHEAEEYGEARSRILCQTCPLLGLLYEGDLPAGLERMALEMEDIILDGAERLAAGFPLAI